MGLEAIRTPLHCRGFWSFGLLRVDLVVQVDCHVSTFLYVCMSLFKGGDDTEIALNLTVTLLDPLAFLSLTSFTTFEPPRSISRTLHPRVYYIMFLFLPGSSFLDYRRA